MEYTFPTSFRLPFKSGTACLWKDLGMSKIMFVIKFSVLFQTSAAIFKILEKKLVQCDQIEVSFLLKSSPRKYFEFDVLQQVASHLIGLTSLDWQRDSRIL